MTSQASQASQNMMQKLLTVQETAVFLNTSTTTVYRYVKKHELPHIRLGLGLRFCPKDLMDWIDQSKRKSIYSENILLKALTIPLAENIFRSEGGGELPKGKKKTRLNFGYGACYIRRTREGNPRFYIDYYDRNGKRIQKLVKNATNWNDAHLALKNAVLNELIDNGNQREEQRILFRDFADIYIQKHGKRKKSWERSDKVYLDANLIPFFGDCLVKKIDALLIEDFIEKRLKDNVRKSTINRDLACLRKMFNKAIDWDYLTVSPFKGIELFPEQEYRRDRILSYEEETRLFKAAASHLRPILTCALMTAMRKSEILFLKWQCVSMENRQIIIKAESAKSGKKRVIPINDMLLKVLEKLEKVNNGGSDFVFLYEDPKTRKLRPVKSVKRAFNMACKRASIENLVFHDLRRSAASRMVSKLVDPISVKRILGHASLKTSEIYLHSSEEQLVEAVKKLDIKSEEKVKKEDHPLHHCDMDIQSDVIH